MELKGFDNKILVAKKECGFSLYMVQWGKLWRYALNTADDVSNFHTVGDIYDNKTHYITNAYDYALRQGFSDKEVLEKYPRKISLMLDSNEAVALNTAKFLISNSSSDHADQCLLYLNKIIDRINIDN
ncbi:hypothetical protein HWD03_gp100 [Alteromonas phage vB_AmeM_PT11-V22]|uniref:Uncharacterized protein n=1 Tax=Alteromonas phage vB_AmeM_PT11-V22 TaxID=2704031 RepID=A0A6C0R0M4_9CAUD|nr:hypothetical protein HWD03_gp100 [Alteromonas phage vB_AmeM_PT11-V22]QHZ59780.1 hypothetical protein [Alteromonas phage vB_AmeM_PT11-V22]